MSGPPIGIGAPASGLPFAGIPPELMGRVDKILAKEPEHPAPEVRFSHAEQDPGRFGLWAFLQPFRYRLLAAVLLVAVVAVSQNIGPWLVAVAIDHGIRAKNFDVLIWTSVAYLAAVTLGVLLKGVQMSFMGRLGTLLMYTLRVRVFSHLQRLSLDFFTGEKVGRLITRMTSDIEALANLLQDGLVNLAVQGITLVVITIILLTMNVQLTLVLLLLVVPAMLVLTLWFRSASEKSYDVVRDRIADVLSDLQESLSGMRLITAFNRHRHNVIHHRNVVGAHRAANDRTARISSFYTSATEFMGVAGQGAIILVGYQFVKDDSLTPGQLIAFILYLSRFFAPIQQLVQLFNGYQSGQAAVTKLRDLLDTSPSVVEKENAVDLPRMAGDVRLENITFSYGRGATILENVDLHIPAGETLSLVGPTGAGKSTISKLIARFYDPDEGIVSIDGVDRRDVTLKSLHQQLGIVPQEPFLFHGSIRDNIAFARSDATDEELLDACAAVGLDDLLSRSPRGLDSPCHERGSSLS